MDVLCILLEIDVCCGVCDIEYVCVSIRDFVHVKVVIAFTVTYISVRMPNIQHI